MRSNSWTEEELELLRQHKPVPFRTAAACAERRRLLGINLHRKPTDAELEGIRNGIRPQWMSYSTYIGIRHRKGYAKPVANWTAEELELLRNHKPVPGRTKWACYRQAKRLGVTPVSRYNQPWTPEEDSQIRNGIIPDGRTKAAVKIRRRKLGLTGGCHKGRWTPKEDALARKSIVPPGRSVETTYRRALELGVKWKHKAPKLSSRRPVHIRKSPYRVDPSDVLKKMGWRTDSKQILTKK